MSGKVSSLPTGGLAQLQSKVDSQSQETKERGRQWLKHREDYCKVKDRSAIRLFLVNFFKFY